MTARGGRAFEPVLVARVEQIERVARAAGEDDAGADAAADAGGESPDDGDDAGARLAVLCPAVGQWRDAPRAGAVITPSSTIGAVEVLGVLHRLVVPANAGGVVVTTLAGEAGPARIPVDHGQVLLVVDPARGAVSAEGGLGMSGTGTAADAAEAQLAFRAPMGGRLYLRPAPDRPPFVSAGDVVVAGQTVCLLEVMKTFNRVVYGGEGLPARARVVAVGPADEDDIAAGDVILSLEEE